MAALTRRTTVYLNPDLHHALRLKSVAVSRSLSDLVNEAVSELLKKDKHKYKLIKELKSSPGIRISKKPE